MIKAVLFDMGNTLLRQDNVEGEKMERAGFINHINVFRKRDRNQPTLEQWSAHFARLRKPLQALAERFHVEIAVDKILASMIEFYDLPRDLTASMLTVLLYQPLMNARVLFPNVEETLTLLRDQNLRLGLISNTPVPGVLCRETLARLGILEYFEFTFFSSELVFRKPHPHMFDTALHRLRLKPAQVLFVGDQIDTDLVGAKAVGLKTAWLNRPGRKKQPKVRHQIADLGEVAELAARL